MDEDSSAPPPGRSGSPWTWVLALALLAGAVVVILGGSRPPLTILLVSMDTTRPDHLSAYGHERDTSPTLERLAREGTVFTQARTTAPWTLPSHMSLFTGLPPSVHGVTVDFHILDRGVPTLGEVFQQAGFRTVGIFTAPYVHGRFGFDRGMEFYERATQFPMAFDLTPDQIAEQSAEREAVSHREITSKRASKRLLFFLEKSRRPHNFFFLHLFDPHYDFRPPGDAYANLFTDPGYDGPVNGDAVLARPDVIHPDMPADDLAHLLALYDTEIRWTDDNLAAVVAGIEARGLEEQTLIMVVSDHGEEFFEHGRIGHRMTLHDEVLKVPMILWGPGRVPAGQVLDDPVSLYDVLPTLADYADIELDRPVEGRSLRPLVEGGSVAPRATHAELTFLYRERDDVFTRHQAMVHQGLKLVRRVDVPWDREAPFEMDAPPDLSTQEFELYDLSADPGETRDLAAADPADPRLAQMRQLHAQELARLERLASETAGARARVQDEFSNQDALDTMKAMGYLEGIQDQVEAPLDEARDESSPGEDPASPDASDG